MLTRRSILTGVASRMLQGAPCVSKPTSDRWRSRIEKYGVAEMANGSARMFYVQLVEEGRLTTEAAAHFRTVHALSLDYPEYECVVAEMTVDVEEKRKTSECFEI